MKIRSSQLERLVSGDAARGGNTASLRDVVAWLLIALVAAFPSHPSGDPRGALEAPVAWPAEPGRDKNPGF